MEGSRSMRAVGNRAGHPAKSYGSQARGEGHEARGKTFLPVIPLPLAPCLSPESSRLQQRLHE